MVKRSYILSGVGVVAVSLAGFLTYNALTSGPAPAPKPDQNKPVAKISVQAKPASLIPLGNTLEEKVRKMNSDVFQKEGRRYGLSYDILTEMYKADPKGFDEAFALGLDWSKLLDGSYANGELSDSHSTDCTNVGTAIFFDTVKGNANVYGSKQGNCTGVYRMGEIAFSKNQKSKAEAFITAQQRKNPNRDYIRVYK